MKMKLLVVVVLIAALSVGMVRNDSERSLCVSCAGVYWFTSNKPIYHSLSFSRRFPESGGRSTEAPRVGKAAHILALV